MPDHDQAHGYRSVDGPDPGTERTDLTSDFSDPAPVGPMSAAAPAAPAPLKIGRYKILEVIARGGMGVVYRAHDPAVGRDVAVKVLQDRFRNQPRTISRFIEEGQVTGQLQHPGVPAVHEIGALPDGSPFLAMRLVKGVTLADRIAEPVPDRGRLVAVFLQVAQAVGYAHSKSVIHRDLKPANVMVGQFGEVQVMDWGLAKILGEAVPRPEPQKVQAALPQHSMIETDRSSDPGSVTQAGSVLGTPAYMPPEQAAGEVEQIDERADVFGLGAILCTILTGEPPFRDKTVEAVRLRAVRGQVGDAYARLDACGADPELIALCKECLAPDRDHRPRNAGAVAVAVSAHLAAVEERMRRAERAREAAKVKAAEQRKRRRWQAAVAGVGVLILALLGFGAWSMDRHAAEREKDRAVAAERDRQEAVALLAHAERVLGAGDLSTADVALTQAAGCVGADGPADLRDRLVGVTRNRDLVRDLREIEDLSWAPGYVSMPDQAEMAERYRAAFVRYGLDVGGADPATAAEAVRASGVSAALVAGLSEWFSTDPDRPHLRQLLDRLDPEPDRVALRAAIEGDDWSRVRALVGALDGSKVPAWFAASVGFHRMVRPVDGVRLMAAAWRSHPADYTLAYRIALRLWGQGDDRVREMLGWAQVAVALRPESPFAHTQLSTAWRAMHNWGEAEASARRAIELSRNSPRYAGAHVGLGNVMLEKGNLNGAEEWYRAALAIDPGAATLYYNLGIVFERRGDLAGAEEWYRKAVAVAPKHVYYRQILDGVVGQRTRLARLDEFATGRAIPATPAEAIEFAELAYRAPRRRYVVAVQLYNWAFTTNPARTDDLKTSHHYNAACLAVMAAAGQDEEVNAFGIEEWGYLTGLAALKWLRADLAQRVSQLKDPKRWQEVRDKLTHWKNDPDLTSVRDPAWLAAMSPPDRKAWEALWVEVDRVLASIPNK